MFRLALALGRTVAELEATLDAREMAEWIAYDRLEPIGPDGDRLIAANLCALTTAAHFKTRGKPRAADFLPWVAEADRKSKRITDQQGMMEFLKGLAERGK